MTYVIVATFIGAAVGFVVTFLWGYRSAKKDIQHQVVRRGGFESLEGEWIEAQVKHYDNIKIVQTKK